MLRKGFLGLAGSDGVRRILTGTPVTRSMSQRFVPGERVEDVVAAIRTTAESGLLATANYLGEAVRSPDDARGAAGVYLELLQAFEDEGLPAHASLKFTQMGQDISEAFLEENLTPVLERARATGTFLRFDMESSAYTTRTLDAFESLWERGWREIGVVLQAYLKRTAGDVRRMIDLGARVRLCKGAYAESSDVAYTEMPRIRKNFVELMEWLMADGVYPAIATHDESLITAAREFAHRQGIGRDRFEFQLLYGVRRDLQAQLVEDGYTVRVYVPFGDQWYPYLMRRLAERPENVAFMVESLVKESPLGFLWPRR
jgi:proline dehydrogenase